jgi:hypothetical protein
MGDVRPFRKIRSMRALILGCCLLCACRGPSAKNKGCPPAEVLESLHAASYWLEQDAPRARVVEALERASAANAKDAWSLDLIQRLRDALDRKDRGDSSWRLQEESARADIRFSPCVTDASHSGFHRALEGTRP